jgi:osmotically-inducible protein OsmY
MKAAIALAAALDLGACASSRTLSGSIEDISSDAELKAVLFADSRHDYSDIDLTVYEGRLMLTGTMPSEEGRRKLVENAWRAKGVTQVIDEVHVGEDTRFRQGVDDSRIDSAIRVKYLTDNDVRSGNYKTSVSNGVVYVLGVARDQKELDEALRRASETTGVVSVVSHVVLRSFPPPPPSTNL